MPTSPTVVLAKAGLSLREPADDPGKIHVGLGHAL
jgi:hypothetical protein